MWSVKRENIIQNFSQLKLSADLATVEHLACHAGPGYRNASVPVHIGLRPKTQRSANTKQTNSFLAFSFCCLKCLFGTVYTYFFWPHSNAAEKIVTKFNKGKVRARAESLHV